MKLSLNPEPKGFGNVCSFSEAEARAMYEGFFAVRKKLGEKVCRSIEVVRAFPFIGPQCTFPFDREADHPSRRLGKINLVFLETPQYSNSQKFSREFTFRLDHDKLAEVVAQQIIENVRDALYGRAAVLKQSCMDISELAEHARKIKPL